MPGETTFASRRIAAGAPLAMRSCNAASAAAFCRPYSLTGQGGASAGTSGRVPSNTLSVDRNSTGMPRASSRSASATVPVTLTRADPAGSRAQSASRAIAAQSTAPRTSPGMGQCSIAPPRSRKGRSSATRSGRRVVATTSLPASCKCLAVAEAISESPPTMRTFPDMYDRVRPRGGAARRAPIGRCPEVAARTAPSADPGCRICARNRRECRAA